MVIDLKSLIPPLSLLFISFCLSRSIITASIVFYFCISLHGLLTPKSQRLETERFISPSRFLSIEGGWGLRCPCPGTWVDGTATILNVVGPCWGKFLKASTQLLLLMFHWLMQVSWPSVALKGSDVCSWLYAWKERWTLVSSTHDCCSLSSASLCLLPLSRSLQ